MNVPFWVPIVMLGLLGVSAFFSASETALFSLEPVDVRRRTAAKGVFADALGWCVGNPRAILLTILLTNLAANTFYFSLAGWWARESDGLVGTIVAVGALILLLFVAEILPKSIALGMAGRFATLCSPAIAGWTRVLTPIRYPLTLALEFLSARVAVGPAVPRALTHDELEEMVKRQPERFGLGKRTAGFVGELVGLTGIQVREVMVPLVDLEPVDVDLPTEEALALVVQRGWRWLLVAGSPGTLGYVDAKDLLIADGAARVGEHVRPLGIIPELARVPHLLELFRCAHVDRVLAVDEYGNDAGIIGREDLIEDIVGGLVRSEHEAGDLPVRLRPGRGWEVRGQLGVHEFEDLFDVRMPIQRNRTIGGLIVEQFGRVPECGERIDVRGLVFEVLGVSRGRVHSVLVCFEDGRS